MKIIIAAIIMFALLAPEASADKATRALRELKGMNKEGKKGGMKGGKKKGGMKVGKKGGKSQQCPAERPPLTFPQCEEESKVKSVRFSTFNGSLNRPNEGDLKRELASPGSAQPDTIATIIQKVRPDVLLINEFDFDEDGVGLKLFMSNYLGVPHEGTEPIDYPYYYNAPSNTGIPSGYDLNNDGTVGGPDDAFGFGLFPGQYGFIVLSKYKIDMDEVRTFQKFLWEDMPCAYLPFYPDSGESWFSEEELKIVRLSSKSHWDVPIEIDGEVVHFLAAHPTPPVFDGPEDRNGKRNHDEIRLFADYISDNEKDSSYIYDDNGNYGGIGGKGKAKFVIVGDYNADPFESGFSRAATMFTENPLINNSVVPSSMGGVEQAFKQGDNNLDHCGPAKYDTADFGEAKFGGPGNVRVDYALPSANMEIVDAGIFWPLEADPDFELVGLYPFPSSDHKMVWVDLTI